MKIDFEESEHLAADEVEVLVRGRRDNALVEQVLAYIADFKPVKIDYIPLKTADRIVMVDIKDIIMVDVEGSKLHLVTTKGNHIITERLYKFKEKVRRGDFVQISKHALVNINHLDYLEDSFSGNMTAFLSQGHKTTVSRKYLKDLLNFLGL